MIDYTKAQTHVTISMNMKIVYDCTNDIQLEYERWHDEHYDNFCLFLSTIYPEFKVTAYQSDELIDHFTIICDSIKDMIVVSEAIQLYLQSINYDLETV